MTILKPQFGEHNFVAIDVNDRVTITLSSKWAQLDKKLLYDHRSDRLLYTMGSEDDTDSVTIKIDFGEAIYIGLIKLLNTNVKSGTIKISEDDISYTTLYTIADFEDTSLHWEASTPGNELADNHFLQAEDGTYILDELGQRIQVDTPSYGRYLLITMTATQQLNAEKYIGELYVGRQAMRLEDGALLGFTQRNIDPNARRLEDFNNYQYSDHVNSVFRPTMIYKTKNVEENAFLRDIVTNGGVFEFFPTGGEYGEEIDYDFSIDDVFLIELQGEWIKQSWGIGIESIVNLILGETRVI